MLMILENKVLQVFTKINVDFEHCWEWLYIYCEAVNNSYQKD